ncbi:hypothetical protein B0H14DRAFT_3860376 [Mycena olivaceomarginata]|nr:hypothetical protein B0H14DRAFT_3860376 [Mycena olivaceomarginata]
MPPCSRSASPSLSSPSPPPVPARDPNTFQNLEKPPRSAPQSTPSSMFAMQQMHAPPAQADEPVCPTPSDTAYEWRIAGVDFTSAASMGGPTPVRARERRERWTMVEAEGRVETDSWGAGVSESLVPRIEACVRPPTRAPSRQHPCSNIRRPHRAPVQRCPLRFSPCLHRHGPPPTSASQRPLAPVRRSVLRVYVDLCLISLSPTPPVPSSALPIYSTSIIIAPTVAASHLRHAKER